jgi:hypothetical protein
MPSDAERLTDLQYARAALVEAQDALFQLGPCSLHSGPVLIVAAAQLHAVGRLRQASVGAIRLIQTRVLNRGPLTEGLDR